MDSKEKVLTLASAARKVGLDPDDLKKLNLIGVKGCLIATALHQKKITKKDLDSFFLSVKKMPRYSRH